VPLSQLIDVVNERFGTDFNQADQLFFDQIVEAAMGDDGLRRAAAVNPGDKFELLFKNVLERLFVDRMDQNEDIFVRFMNDVPFQKVVTSWMAEEAYRRLRTNDVSPQGAASSKLRLVEGAREGAVREVRAARAAQGGGRRVQRPAARRRRRLRVGRGGEPAPAAVGHVRRAGRRALDGAWHRRRRLLPLRCPGYGIAARDAPCSSSFATRPIPRPGTATR
jgi:hypothetical protein